MLYSPSCGARASRVSGLRKLAAVMPQPISPRPRHIIHVNGLMRAGESTDAQMDDSRTDGTAVIARLLYLGG